MGKKQFLAALMLTVLLTGCGGSGKAAATQKDPVQVPLSEALKKKKIACSKCYD